MMKQIVARVFCAAFLLASGVAVVIAGPLTSQPAVALIDRLQPAVLALAF